MLLFDTTINQSMVVLFDTTINQSMVMLFDDTSMFDVTTTRRIVADHNAAYPNKSSHDD